jgi:hypothetical protein
VSRRRDPRVRGASSGPRSSTRTGARSWRRCGSIA